MLLFGGLIMKYGRLIKYGSNRGILLSIWLCFVALSAAPVHSAAIPAHAAETTREKAPGEPFRSMEVLLSGVFRYEVTLAFDRILQQAPGIGAVQRVSMQLVSDRPLESRVVWAIDCKELDAAEVELFIFDRLRELAFSKDPALPTWAPRLTREDRAVLSEIFPWKATSRGLYFARFTPGRPEVFTYTTPAEGRWIPGRGTGFE
jgi:hypothetical protein